MIADQDARELSPFTGWTRGHWTALADRMLRALRPLTSPGGARIVLPGPTGGLGADVDGLEGFARTFLLAGFRLAGERGHDPDHLAERYAQGLASGVDPASPERWPRPDEHAQAKVEAASLALVLDLTRPWLWDLLPERVRAQVVDYLSPVVGDDGYPRCNWLWFRVVVQTFLRSVGGPWRAEDVESDLALHEGFLRADSWYSDGDERAFDHYTGWAMHLYPVLWSRMRGARELTDRSTVDAQRLDRYLRDHVNLIGADGSPLVQGRSLTYRFAAAAPLWAGALAEVPSTPPGLLRRAASGIVRHFADRGAPDERGLLTLGWHRAWPRIAQSYSGPSSPYWAAKGMLGLALPADHPVWRAVEEPLPVETGDRLWVATAPGWLVSGTRADGVVRVVNHGADHAVEGAHVGDSPLYARLGYSTATAPPLSERAWSTPADQSAALLDAAGRATHRAGMSLLRTGLIDDGRVALGASRARAHWLADAPPARDHGSGRTGEHTDVALITVVSLLRGPWEVRCVRVDPLPEDPGALDAATALRVGGWPLAARTPPEVSALPHGLTIATGDVVSTLLTAEPGDTLEALSEHDASPLGPHSATPCATGRITRSRWRAYAIGLARTTEPPAAPTTGLAAADLRVTWPDGRTTALDLDEFSP
ncbi:DUF2264 domain-containing protein [Actinosynnema pretiosum subsp. pretiosum]|uniref:DUF2264 domain-containing protein n=1 Tax=Actinosynnema pretiosum subsp. pretiosum TaxID=103721 RepID=A0AA45LA17_9PSEU|nr:hypothetical protein APASM_2947 [Actinosynnema pretiosum subsp. pretiosum]QUF05533.1 DUF2264 domain-containing protein [Actinosynnema pretiosum subsp. pretiosum]